MDKNQKELINTYLRKRYISNRGTGLALQRYEINYMAENDPDYLNHLRSDQLLTLLLEKPHLISRANLSRFDTFDAAEFLRRSPQYIDEINILDRFHSSDIVQVLLKQPQLENRFKLSKITQGDMTTLIEYQPQFLDKFDLSRLIGTSKLTIALKYPETILDGRIKITENEIITKVLLKHLRQYPKLLDVIDVNNIHDYEYIKEIINKFPRLVPKLNLKEKFVSNYDIRNLLVWKPKLIDQFSEKQLHSLEPSDIYSILSKYPELIYRLNNWTLLPSHVTGLLKIHPDLIDKLNIHILRSYDLEQVLSQQPQLIDKLDMSNIDNDYASKLVSTHPNMFNKLKEHMSSFNQAKFVIKHPEAIKDVDITKWNGWGLSLVFERFPKLKKNFDFSELQGDDVGYLIEHHPDLLNKFKDYQLGSIRNLFRDYTQGFFKTLISKRPDMLDFINFEYLEGNEIGNLLEEMPQVVEWLVPVLYKLWNPQIQHILTKQPQLAPYFSDRKLGKTPQEKEMEDTLKWYKYGKDWDADEMYDEKGIKHPPDDTKAKEFRKERVINKKYGEEDDLQDFNTNRRRYE